jgi:hypothetical protein
MIWGMILFLDRNPRGVALEDFTGISNVFFRNSIKEVSLRTWLLAGHIRWEFLKVCCEFFFSLENGNTRQLTTWPGQI